MDSLLANYASSDDEEDHNSAPSIPISSSSLFSSLPNPKPNSTLDEHKFDNPRKLPLFSSIPKPQQSELSKPPKRVVQFKPPFNPINDLDDDDDDEIERKRRKESQPNSQSGSSVLSFLSTIPAPKNSSQLGALPSASGSARRSNIGLETTPTFNSTVDNVQNEEKSRGFVNHETGFASSSDNNNNQEVSYDDSSGYDASYHGDYYEGQDGNNWGGDGGVYEITEPSVSDNLVVPGKKRRKNEMATQIIEVTQDELTKNRPREDQAKLTGIAFGPSYQPASSTKGKPSKLHKRKHQIGSLYFDMKQKETELAERRAKGFLTKAQTHAKYGW